MQESSAVKAGNMNEDEAAEWREFARAVSQRAKRQQRREAMRKVGMVAALAAAVLLVVWAVFL